MVSLSLSPSASFWLKIQLLSFFYQPIESDASDRIGERGICRRKNVYDTITVLVAYLRTKMQDDPVTKDIMTSSSLHCCHITAQQPHNTTLEVSTIVSSPPPPNLHLQARSPYKDIRDFSQ